MTTPDQQTPDPPELDEEDIWHISEIFHDRISPRLMKMHARIGKINCDFAGEKYANWDLEFRSFRSGFDIVGFEYNENPRSFPLPPLSPLKNGGFL